MILMEKDKHVVVFSKQATIPVLVAAAAAAAAAADFSKQKTMT
jgi:hypothetical protein